MFGHELLNLGVGQFRIVSDVHSVLDPQVGILMLESGAKAILTVLGGIVGPAGNKQNAAVVASDQVAQ